jgi:hypothetical protein
LEELLLMSGVEACAARIAPGDAAAADAAVRLALSRYVGGAGFGEAAAEALRFLVSSTGRHAASEPARELPLAS